MLQPCQDNYSTTFASYDGMRRYHEKESLESRWHRCKVNELHIEPLDKASPLYGTPSAFASGISAESVEDTAENLGLAMRVDGSYYPVRSTAYKSLLDRAKISGSALPKLSRQRLASVLNDCLELYSIDELLKVLTKKLDDRFPGSMFQGGYRDHSLSSASWTMPGQKEDLLGAYAKLLASQGKSTLAAKLVPAIRFVTSDTGIASAKVSAMLEGTQFGDSVARLQKLLDIHLSYPVNAMTRICKKLSLPKKAALEAIGMFEMAYGGGTATAHDVFMAMQEIPYILKSDHAPESKMLVVEENMARALTLRWGDYDLAKAVSY